MKYKITFDQENGSGSHLLARDIAGYLCPGIIYSQSFLKSFWIKSGSFSSFSFPEYLLTLIPFPDLLFKRANSFVRLSFWEPYFKVVTIWFQRYKKWFNMGKSVNEKSILTPSAVIVPIQIPFKELTLS